jgi:MFS transporter, FSR family, fosmidomycin resistance protein
LGLSYAAVGVLLSLPHVFGNVIEPPLGLLGDGWNRRAIVRGGGVAFVAALLLIACSTGFPMLLVALMIASPASGAFVALSQTVLMDLDVQRREQNMARWVLAGSLGMVLGPLALAAAGMAGLGWRAAFAAFAVLAAALLATAWSVPMPAPAASGEPVLRALRRSALDAVGALRRRAVVRWLTLLQLADLMLDVFHAFLALYFVDAVGTSDVGAMFAIVVWTGVGLLGDALLVPLLERFDGVRWLRLSAAATLLAFPAFLLVPQPSLKLALLASLALLSSGWYAILKARLYDELPGRSATVMALGSVFGIAGAALPLGVGLAAHSLGIGPAMWLLLGAPVALLVGTRAVAADALGPPRE